MDAPYNEIEERSGIGVCLHQRSNATYICTAGSSLEDDEVEINAAIQRLKEEGFVNDRDFADWYCMQRESFNPRSQRILYLELVSKGVDPVVVKSSIQDYHSEEDSCRTLALRKVGALSHEKLISYLMGKVGFVASCHG